MPSMEMVLEMTKRVPFEDKELMALIEFVKANQRNGLDTNFHQIAHDLETIREGMSMGFMLLSSPVMLETDIMFAKLDGGRGFFGGQKSVYATYISPANRDDFSPGPTFKMWAMALTSINNVYRGEGFLKGAAV